jgi:hypothetical protein
VALAITALAVLAVVGVLIFAAKARGKADGRAEATSIVSSLTWNAIARLQEDFDTPVAVVSAPVGEPLDRTGRYLYSIEEELVGPPPARPEDLKALTVTVSWESDTGPQTLSVRTKVGR